MITRDFVEVTNVVDRRITRYSVHEFLKSENNFQIYSEISSILGDGERWQTCRKCDGTTLVIYAATFVAYQVYTTHYILHSQCFIIMIIMTTIIMKMHYRRQMYIEVVSQ